MFYSSANGIKTNMKKISIGGYYGMNNYGDDLFGIIGAKGANRYWRDVEIKIVCPTIKGIKENFIVPEFFPKSIYASDSYIGKLSRLGFAFGGSRFADKFVFCGGSIFSSCGSGVMNALFDLYSKRTSFFSALGVSIGPFDSLDSEKKTKERLKRFEYISLRDKESYDIATYFELECPIVLAADLAGMIPILYSGLHKEHRFENGKKRIGFSPCFFQNESDRSRQYCDSFIEGICQLKGELDFQVVVLNLNEHLEVGDIELSNYVHDALKKHGIVCDVVSYGIDGVIPMWERISSLNAYVSVRLHGAISAYLNKIPFALYEYHVKCTEFLNDIGQDNRYRITDNSLSPDFVKQVIMGLLSAGENTILPIDKYCAKSELNFTMSPWTIDSYVSQ